MTMKLYFFMHSFIRFTQAFTPCVTFMTVGPDIIMSFDV